MLDSLLYVIEEILLKKVYLFFVVFKLLWYISCFWFLLTVFAFRVKSILILSTRITKYNRVESRECLINLLVHTVLQNVIKGSVKQTKNVLINIFSSLVDTSFKESYTHIIYIFFFISLCDLWGIPFFSWIRWIKCQNFGQYDDERIVVRFDFHTVGYTGANIR